MKKTWTIVGALFLNFCLYAVSIAFYAEGEGNTIAKGTTDMPVIQFLIGCYLVPWYFLNKRNLSKGLHIAVLGLFTWSFLSMWVCLTLTNGFFSGLLNLVSFIVCLALPLGVYYALRYKEKKLQEKAKYVPPIIKSPSVPKAIFTPNEGKDVDELEAIKSILASVEDPEVHEKGEEIVGLLTDVLKEPDTLGVEERHIMERLITKDLPGLFQNYVRLNQNKQDAIEKDLLQNLDIIVNYLQSILDGVSDETLNEMKMNMELIETRYKK